jgi:hypothetical protein
VTLYCVNNAVTVCELGGALALFDMTTNSYFSLNQSGGLIWERAHQPASRAQLRRAVADAYGKAEPDIADDVDRAITALVDAGLLLAVESDASTPAEAIMPPAA